MRYLNLIASIAALSFFSYSQHQGMSLYTGADSYAQQSSGQRSSSGGRVGSSSISHK